MLAFSLVAYLLVVILQKHCGSKFQNKSAMYHVYNACVSSVCMITLIAVSGNLKVSAFTIILGVVFGLITALGSIFSLKALESGPLSYTTVITSLSTIIPAMSGYLFWGEDIELIQLIGVAFMLVCFVFSVEFSGEKKEASIRWFVFAMTAFFCTGFIGVMQKWHQNSLFKNELDGFLVIAFAISTLYSLCMVFIEKRKSGKGVKEEINPLLIVFMIIAGICSAANNKINLYLSGIMDSAVFFPVVNGGGLVLASLASYIVFKEKLSLKKWIGILIGIVAVLLLCNPF
jgi:drug/metabolite transporter (DMT)-like permease